ncbi:nucleotidyltransferase [Streptomyces ruber]|uniref:Nucleotidyltransferase n=2 Tax=Streptomyces TaxID=1883 RepID=A0A918BE42_9ACTN|nr:aminoglycoside adenylyltransferase family protein [Streptomyces ruber]GGQ59364.1 nucleotidyltransferase [Streptomyces ruber]
MTQLDAVVGLVRRVLGSALLGAYAHGSAVLGGLRPFSDLDVLAVTRRRTAAEERQALVDGLLGMSGAPGGPVRPVELTVVARDDVRPWRHPPRREFQYGEWLREEYERGTVPEPADDPDLAPVLTMTLRGGTALYGPPPAEVLDPVPAEDLRRAVLAGVPGLLAGLESDTRNVLLTLARVWTTLETGDIRSKDAAAAWALDRLPPGDRPVLAHARAAYLGHEPDRLHTLVPEARALADRMVRAVGVRDRG